MVPGTLGLAVVSKKKEGPMTELKWGVLSLGPTFGEMKKPKFFISQLEPDTEQWTWSKLEKKEYDF